MPEKRKRGFAAMNPQKQREIATKGGQAAHKKGTAHEFSPEEARLAGRLGGKAVSTNRAHMAAIGRKGGQRSAVEGRPFVVQNGHPHHEQNHNHEYNNEGEHYMAKNAFPKATELIRADHKQVSALFHQYNSSNGQIGQKENLARQICTELEMHAQLEEEIFYPAVKAKSDEEGKEKVQEGIREHQKIKRLIAHLKGQISDDDEYDTTVDELKQCVEHHVSEEESEVLPEAEQNLGYQLQQLGAQMQRRKQQLLGAMQPTRELEMREQ